ncbi:MAG: HEAT repeat domain-containing protein, partial [Vicinamibacterales bacterium]
MVNAALTVVAAALLALVPIQAQAPENRERLLAQGWAELAAGRPAGAARAAARVLDKAPRDHDAASLAVAAGLATGGAARALETYERWVRASGRDDLMLLEDIAAAELRVLSTSAEARILYPALVALAKFGDVAARQRLRELAKDTSIGVEADAALAAAGDPAGAGRLRARIAAGGREDKSRAIEAMKSSGDTAAAGAIAQALKDPSPPSRIAAAQALAELGATQTIPLLREAEADPEPSVRGAVQTALALLGDPERTDVLKSLQDSPLADYRLLAARQAASRDPRGTWVAAVEAMLGDADPVIRLQAAELLLLHGHTAAADSVMSGALNDSSGPLRAVAARVLGKIPLDLRGLTALRVMLRDPLPDVRLEAARALLIS